MMSLKRIVLSTAAMAVCSTFAHAADMPPVRKAPVIEPPQMASGYVELYSGWASNESYLPLMMSSSFTCPL